MPDKIDRMESATPEPILSILITNYNTAHFLEVSCAAFDRLTQHPFVVLVNDNGSTPDQLKRLQALERRYSWLKVFYRSCSLGGSQAHAQALDFLIAQSATPYTAVFDSDCMPLMYGWDRYMIERLSDEVKIFGSPMSRNDGSSEGLDFPWLCMKMFDTAAHQALAVSSAPGDVRRGEDTCWRWRPAYEGAGYRGAVLTARHTRFFPEAGFPEILCAVYYTDDGRVIGSHFGRGHTQGEAKYASGLMRLPVLGGYLRRRKGRQEIRRWLRRCSAIIETEARHADKAVDPVSV